MGGSSSSSSSTTNQTETNQTDRRIGATDNATVIAAEPNSTLNLNVTDENALNAAIKAGEFAAESFDKALLTVDKAAQVAQAAAEAAGDASANGTGTNIAKWAAVGVIGYGALKGLKWV